MAKVKSKYVEFGGGEDLVSPPIGVDPGRALFALNFDPGVNGGYDRIKGYERYDGQAAPHLSTGSSIGFTGGQIEPDIGTVLYGSTSGALGILTSINITGGSWSSKDAVGFFNVSDISGEFVVDEMVVDEEASPGGAPPLARGFSPGFDEGFG